MAGPATNAATITMIAKVLGKRSLITYMATIIAGGLSFGFIIDYLLPAEWFTQIVNEHLGHQHEHGLVWWQIASGVLLLAFIINGYIQNYIKSKNQKKYNSENNTMEIKTIKVDGMTCNHCKMNVENNLKKLPFIENATVNLADKSVLLEGEKIEIEKAKEIISSLGYTPV